MPSGKSSTRSKELFLGLGPAGNGGRPTGAGQDRHQGDDDDADQGMLAIDGRTGVLQIVEMGNDFVNVAVVNLRHDWFSENPSTGSRPENGLPSRSSRRNSLQDRRKVCAGRGVATACDSLEALLLSPYPSMV